MPLSYDPVDDDVYKQALAKLGGAPVSPLSIANGPPQPPQAAPQAPPDAPPPQDAPPALIQTPKAPPTPEEMSQEQQLEAQALQSMRRRLADSETPPDTAGLKAAMAQGYGRGQGAQIGGGFARAAVGQFSGGNSDPAAFLGLLMRGNQNAIENADKQGQVAREQPVQEYMNLQAQKKLQLEEARRATDEAIKYGREKRLERKGDASGMYYSEGQKEMTRKALTGIAAQMGIDVEDPQFQAYIADAHPGNQKLKEGTLVTMFKNNARGAQFNAREARLLDHEEWNRPIVEQRLAATTQNAGARQEMADTGRLRLGLAGAKAEFDAPRTAQKFAQDVGTKNIPGVEFNAPVDQRIIDQGRVRKAQTAEAIRAFQAYSELLKDRDFFDKVVPGSEAHGELKARYFQLFPKGAAAEFANAGASAFTVGHLRLAEKEILAGHGVKGWALMNEAVGMAKANLQELDHAYRSFITQNGGKFYNEEDPYSDNRPGKTAGMNPNALNEPMKKVKAAAGAAQTYAQGGKSASAPAAQEPAHPDNVEVRLLNEKGEELGMRQTMPWDEAQKYIGNKRFKVVDPTAAKGAQP